MGNGSPPHLSPNYKIKIDETQIQIRNWTVEHSPVLCTRASRASSAATAATGPTRGRSWRTTGKVDVLLNLSQIF